MAPPKESSATRPTSLVSRNILPVKTFRGRDPRFDPNARENARDTHERYGVMLTQMRKDEIAALKEQRAEAKRNGASHEEMEYFRVEIDRLENRVRETERRNKIREYGDRLREEEAAKIAETGKKAFYYSTDKIKQIIRQEEFEALEKAGKVDSVLKKRMERQSHRDRASLGAIERKAMKRKAQR